MFNKCQIKNNTTVIDKANNWNILLFKEAYMNKTQRPSLNCEEHKTQRPSLNCVRASKELQLF